jgi:hypothetical protein
VWPSREQEARWALQREDAASPADGSQQSQDPHYYGVASRGEEFMLPDRRSHVDGEGDRRSQG